MSLNEGKGSKTDISISAAGENTTLDMTMNSNFKSKNNSITVGDGGPLSRNAI